jgi:hypothetical protein
MTAVAEALALNKDHHAAFSTDEIYASVIEAHLYSPILDRESILHEPCADIPFESLSDSILGVSDEAKGAGTPVRNND